MLTKILSLSLPEKNLQSTGMSTTELFIVQQGALNKESKNEEVHLISRVLGV